MSERDVADNCSAVALATTVGRYLEAIQGIASSMRRREQSTCHNLLQHVRRAGAESIDPGFVRSWLELTSTCNSPGRRRRLATLRRLVALAPGSGAAWMAAWLDQNRSHLLSLGPRPKVVPLRPAADRDVNGARALAVRAQQWHEAGEPVRARTLARRALRMDPCCLRAQAVLGVLALQGGRPGAALRQFREALVLAGDPSDRDGIEGIPEVLHGLGATLLAVGCFEEAEEVFGRLRYAGDRWRAVAEPLLGRIALARGQPGAAAEAFSAGPPEHQYNTFFARLLCGETLRAAIAFCRGLIANPVVPSALLRRPEVRFIDSLPPEAAGMLLTQAATFVSEWSSLWDGREELLEVFEAMWDHPASRSLLMRALPLAAREPASPRLAVLVHAAAGTLAAYVDESGLLS